VDDFAWGEPDGPSVTRRRATAAPTLASPLVRHESGGKSYRAGEVD
jgi:hypothetical protein